MEPAYVAVLSFVFLFSLHRFLGHRRRRKFNGKDKGTRHRLPPGPPAIPVLGHLADPRRALRPADVLPSPRLAGRGARQGVLHRARHAHREPPELPLAGPRVVRRRHAPNVVRYGPYWRNLRRVATVHTSCSRTAWAACSPCRLPAEVRAIARSIYRAAVAVPGGAARVELKRRLFELSLSALMETIARSKTSSTEAEADNDMSPKTQEFKEALDEFIPLIGAANMCHYLPACYGGSTCSA